jgi:hypothetical protein
VIEFICLEVRDGLYMFEPASLGVSGRLFLKKEKDSWKKLQRREKRMKK